MNIGGLRASSGTLPGGGQCCVCLPPLLMRSLLFLFLSFSFPFLSCPVLEPQYSLSHLLALGFSSPSTSVLASFPGLRRRRHLVSNQGSPSHLGLCPSLPCFFSHFNVLFLPPPVFLQPCRPTWPACGTALLA